MSDKLRYDLLPPQPLEDLVEVYTIGAKKHGERDWEKPGHITNDEHYQALMRHLQAHRLGEQIDSDDGQLHMASVAWRAFAILFNDHREANQEVNMMQVLHPPVVEMPPARISHLRKRRKR